MATRFFRSYDDALQVLPSGRPESERGALADWLAEVDELVDTEGRINLRRAGAAGDDIDNDYDSFVTALAASASTGKPLFIPKGRYRIYRPAAPFVPVSNMTICGDGDESVLHYIDDTTEITGVTGLFYKHASEPVAEYVTLRDFAIEGEHASDYLQYQRYPISLNKVNYLSILRVKITYSRTMGMAMVLCKDPLVRDCIVNHCARDGIHFNDCSGEIVMGNRISQCDDDAIALTGSAFGDPDKLAVAAGNTIYLSQGIRALGKKSLAITGNAIELCCSQGINVSTVDTGDQGRGATNGITISGNTIKNIFARPDGLNTGNDYITMSGDSAQDGGLAAIPGENDVATGTVIDPYPYWQNPVDGITTTPVPYGRGIVVASNILMRDIPPLAAVSEARMGTLYTRTGPSDPAITVAALSGSAISTTGGGSIKGLVVTGNFIAGMGEALRIGSGAVLQESLFSGNVCSDLATGASAVNGEHSILFKGNRWNLDPYMKSTNRGANGTWLANGSPTVFLLQSAKGFVVEGDTFRNACRVNDGVTGVVFMRCILECDPTGSGFSAANKGIGNCPLSGEAYIYSIVDSDPASATYGTLLNTCSLDAAAIPSAGKYMRGHFTRNTAVTIASGKITLGWARATTGSDHVAGTDWHVCVVANS